MIQANHGLTMITDWPKASGNGAGTDISTAFDRCNRSVVGRWLQRCRGTDRPPRESGGHRQPILQRKSFVIEDFPSKRKPGSRDVPGSDPSTSTPPARGSRSCAWCGRMFHFNHSDGLCSTEKIKAIDKTVLGSPCDHFLAESIWMMRDRRSCVGWGDKACLGKEENRDEASAGHLQEV